MDCRSLIEFCRAFEHHRNGQPSRKRSSLLSHPFCEHSPFAAIDIVILLFALVALAVLALPYFKFILQESLFFLPPVLHLTARLIYRAPLAYAAGLLLAFVSAVAAWEIIDHKGRKCGNPSCRGLRRSVEFDIQLESEECVRHLPPPAASAQPKELEIGGEHKELEAELKKMAPLNGRTVLIFRAPCGCPAGRMEVWGNKKVRRIKK